MRSKHFLITVFLLTIGSIFTTTFGQTIATQQLIRRYKHMAAKSFKSGNYNMSMEYHRKLDSLMPGVPEVKYNLAICYLNSNYKYKALPYLQEIFKAKYTHPELNYQLGKSYHYASQFDSSTAAYLRFLKEIDTTQYPETATEVKRKIEINGFAKEIAADSLPLLIESAGPEVNTPDDEYVPIVSADQQLLYFTSRRKNVHNVRMSHDGRYYEDIYLSTKDSLGNWTKGKDVDYPLNGPEHDACIGISPDGHNMFIYRMKSTDQQKGSIFSSKLNGILWSKPSKLGTHINTRKGWESSVSISSNGKRLYFSSDRAGGYGGFDIYYSDLRPNNEWGEPVNAGPEVNSSYDEDCPYIHFDNVTLFFSSNGHKTMGGYDVFTSVFNEDSLKWTLPHNLGSPINTVEDDMYFIYSADGSKGYLSSSLRPDSEGERDIYVVNRPQHSLHMIVLRGKVYDEETNKPMESYITVTDLEKNEVVGVFTSNSESGRYVLALDFGKNYSIQFESHGYLFHSENINIQSKEVVFDDTRDFKLKRIKEGNILVLNNLFFDYNKYDLKHESMPELDKLQDFMKKHPNVRIEIGGHTDSIGGNAFNSKLSKKRALAVKNYLTSRGIDKHYIRSKGYGETRPVAKNNTEQGRRLNRRTECLIYDIEDLKPEDIIAIDQAADTINDDILILEEITPSRKKGDVLKPKVHFLYNNGEFITEFSKHQLETVCEALKRIPRMKLEIHASTDFVGQEHNNKELYQARVHTVLEYFSEKGFSKDRFKVKPFQQAAAGKVADMTKGDVENRKVHFVLVDY